MKHDINHEINFTIISLVSNNLTNFGRWHCHYSPTVMFLGTPCRLVPTLRVEEEGRLVNDQEAQEQPLIVGQILIIYTIRCIDCVQ